MTQRKRAQTSGRNFHRFTTSHYLVRSRWQSKRCCHFSWIQRQQRRSRRGVWSVTRTLGDTLRRCFRVACRTRLFVCGFHFSKDRQLLRKFSKPLIASSRSGKTVTSDASILSTNKKLFRYYVIAYSRWLASRVFEKCGVFHDFLRILL